MSKELHQKRIDNVRHAEQANRQYLRRVRVRDYLAGQAIYCLGDYPAKISAAPTDYDRALIKKLAEDGIQLIQVHEEWNDAVRLYGADKFNAVDRQGMKDFVKLCHKYGIKVIAYVSSGYFHEGDPDFREEFTLTKSTCTSDYFNYRRCNHGNALWRDYILPRTLNVMDEYGFDGIFNDWGYDYIKGDVSIYDEDLEDMLSIIYSEIKKRGGVYKLHCDGNHQPPCQDKVYDYLWIGEGIRKSTAGVGKDYPTYVVPCQDRHFSQEYTLKDYLALTVPFLQFPLMKTGRPVMGNNIDLPGVTYYGGDEQEFYKAVGRYMKDHPDGPYVYSLWSSIPDDVTEYDTWVKYFALYRPMVQENSLAYIELRDCEDIASPLPENVYASMFVSDEVYMVVSNLEDEEYTLVLNGTWRDRETGETGSSFPIQRLGIRFLVKVQD